MDDGNLNECKFYTMAQGSNCQWHIQTGRSCLGGGKKNLGITRPISVDNLNITPVPDKRKLINRPGPWIIEIET
jgi:hypothetical protein